MNRASLSTIKCLRSQVVARSLTAAQPASDWHQNDQWKRFAMGSAAALLTATFFVQQKVALAKEQEVEQSDEKKLDEPEKKPTEEEKPKKFKMKQMHAYENKLRMHSQPDKVFRYFATVAAICEDTRNNDVYMTPEDLIRSLTPGGELQPSHLLLDQYRKIKTSQKSLKMGKKDLAKCEPTFRAFGGYINYEDYMFLLMMLTTPRRNFEIAFRMFDLDGNGVVDAQEFDKVTETIMKGTTVGKRHTAKKKMSNIASYFFGDDRSKTLTSEEFIEFQSNFHRDILKMEFDLMNPDPETGLIRERDFANMLLVHARFDKDKARKIQKRVNKFFKKKKVKEINEDGEEVVKIVEYVDEGVSFEQVVNFFNFIKNIHDVEIAFTFFAMAGKEIDEFNLKEVARNVCGVEVNDRVIKIIYCIFDDDMNGTLTHKEFCDVMKKRLIRGLDSKREIGFVSKFTALATCGYEAYTPDQVKKLFETIGEKVHNQKNPYGDDFEGQFK